MSPRLDAYKIAPQTVQAMLTLETQLRKNGLEASLIHLIKLRASQINGCTYCMHMHASEALKDGERDIRLHVLAGWRESPLFSERERAGLAWTEALTLVAQTHAPDDDYAQLNGHFSPEEQVQLTAMIGMINSWNRLAVGFRFVHPVQMANTHATTD